MADDHGTIIFVLMRGCGACHTIIPYITQFRDEFYDISAWVHYEGEPEDPSFVSTTNEWVSTEQEETFQEIILQLKNIGESTKGANSQARPCILMKQGTKVVMLSISEIRVLLNLSSYEVFRERILRIYDQKFASVQGRKSIEDNIYRLRLYEFARKEFSNLY